MNRQNTYDAFFSFDWGVAPHYQTLSRVREIAAMLGEQGLNICVDPDRVDKDCKRVEESIDSSAVVVIFVTKKYMLEIFSNNSERNCGSEFCYALRRKKLDSLITVVLDVDVKSSTSWIGSLASNLAGAVGSFYLRFYEDAPDRDHCKTLFRAIRKKSQCNRKSLLLLNAWVVEQKEEERRRNEPEPEVVDPLAGKVLEVGSRVEGNFEEQGEWLPGRITYERKDGTFDVDYENGEEEMRVQPARLCLIAEPVEEVIEETVEPVYLNKEPLNGSEFVSVPAPLHTDGPVIALANDGSICRCDEDAKIVVMNNISLKNHGNSKFLTKILKIPTQSRVQEVVLKGSPKHMVHALMQLRNGRVCSGSIDKTLRIWNPETGFCDLIIDHNQDSVSALCQYEDGRIVSGSHFTGKIYLWNLSPSLDSADCSDILYGHTNTVTSLIQLKNGSLCSSSVDKTICLWRVRAGSDASHASTQCHAVLQGHTGPVTVVIEDSYSSARLCSGSMDKTIRIWNPDTFSCDLIIDHNQDSVSALCQYEDGRIVSGSHSTGKIYLWNLNPTMDGSNAADCSDTLYGHTNTVTSLFQLADGRLCSSSADRSIKFWGKATLPQFEV